MKKKKNDANSGFSRPLAQQFLILRRKSEEASALTSTQTLNVIIDGIMELSCAIAEGAPTTLHPFSSTAHGIFSQLVETCNDPDLLKRAGMHYLVEWQLPHAALGHFQRALELGSTDKKLPMLIDIADVAVKRKLGIYTTASGRVAAFPRLNGTSGSH